MKKIFIIVTLIIFISIIFIKYIPFGYTTFKSDDIYAKELIVPKMSHFEEECCMFSANFKSFRSKIVLEKELNRIMKNYDERKCNDNIYYYDKKNNITITEYGVERTGLLNRIYIVYDIGDIYNECN